MFAALCHDLGKATTTELRHGRWTAHGHCEAGVPLTRSFLESIGCPECVIAEVEPLVQEHLIHTQSELSGRSVRRLSLRLGKASITQLMRLVEADLGGRPPLPGTMPPTATEILRIASELEISAAAPRPIIQGRHLIALGHKPNDWFGKILKACFEAQIDGQFSTEEEGLVVLQDLLKSRY